ncbi:MAG: hypothetical protein PW791_12750 [Neorhizobium sp.]|nr:hypothetical protein [Neorhizobium sp.]
MYHSTKARLLFTGAALSIFATPIFATSAFALDGTDLVAKINAALSLQGGSIKAQSIDISGTTVTLKGTSFKAESNPQQFPIGNVTMDGVEEANGGYTIEKVAFPNINLSQEQNSVSVTDITMSGVKVPADVNKGTIDSLLLYDEAHVGPITVSANGKQLFSVAETNVSTAVSDDNSGLDFDLKMDKIKADLSTVDDPNSRETIDALGLNTIDGSMTLSGSWAQNDGTVDISEYALDIANVGKLDLALSFSGYTLDFMKSARETAKAMEANANKQEAQQAASLAMLGLMQRLTFNSAQIRFDDAGITKRALDYAGKQQNTTGDQMAQMVKAMTPIVLAQYNVPELQNMLSQAVNTFLDKPQNLTVDAEPANPVPLPMIMGAAMGAPNTLPKVLGLKVSAND